MKQLFTLILAVLLSAGSFAQENNEQQSIVILEKKMHDVQLNLRQASRNHTASLLLGIVGAGVMTVPAFSNSNNNAGYYMLGGGCLAFSFILGQVAWSNIGQAGKVGWEKPQRQYYYYDDTPVPDDGWEPETEGDLSEEIGPGR